MPAFFSKKIRDMNKLFPDIKHQRLESIFFSKKIKDMNKQFPGWRQRRTLHLFRRQAEGNRSQSTQYLERCEGSSQEKRWTDS